MRNQNDIMNYFRRSAERKKARLHKKKADQKLRAATCSIAEMKHEMQRNTDWHFLYSELITRLQKVPEYCAVRNPKTIRINYPLERFVTSDFRIRLPSKMPVLQHSHAVNMYYAEALVEDFIMEECIHFRMETAEGMLGYQYSKKGIAIQSFTQILKEVTWMLTYAWFKKIHKEKGND